MCRSILGDEMTKVVLTQFDFVAETLTKQAVNIFLWCCSVLYAAKGNSNFCRILWVKSKSVNHNFRDVWFLVCFK